MRSCLSSRDNLRLLLKPTNYFAEKSIRTARAIYLHLYSPEVFGPMSAAWQRGRSSSGRSIMEREMLCCIDDPPSRQLPGHARGTVVRPFLSARFASLHGSHASKPRSRPVVLRTRKAAPIVSHCKTLSKAIIAYCAQLNQSSSVRFAVESLA
jgi:hypothetical protein